MMRFIAASIVLATLPAGARPAAQDTVAVPSFAKLMAADTFLFISVRDVAVVRKHLDAAGLKSLAEEKQVKEFLDAVGQGLAGWTDGEGAALWGAVDGEIAFAVGPVDYSKGPPEVYLFVNAGQGKADAAADAIRRGIARAPFGGDVAVEEESFKGAKIAKYLKDGIEQIASCRSGTWFAIAPTSENLKRLLDRPLDSKGGDLASSPAFAATLKAVGEDADVVAFLNFAEFIRLNRDLEPGKDRKPGIAELIGGGLGIDGIRSFGFGLSVGEDRVTARIHVDAPGGLKGFTKAIFPGGENPSIPAFVPDGVHAFGAARFDFATAYKAFSDTVSSVLKRDGEKLDLDSIARESLGVDLKDAVFDNLTGEIVTATTYRRPFKPTSVESVQVVGLKDGVKLDKALGALLAALSDKSGGFLKPEEEDDRGAVIRTMAGLSFALKENRLVVGDKAAVKSTLGRLGGSGASVADSPAFKELAKDLPAKYSSIGFATPEGTEYYLALLKDGRLKDLFGSSVFGYLPEDPQIRELRRWMEQLDLSILPDAPILTKRMVGMISYSTVDDRGFTLTSLLRLKK